MAHFPTPYAFGAPIAYNQAPIAYNQAPIAYNQVPLAYNQAPVVAAAPVPVAAPALPYTASSQFQAQDEFGNINYGYSNINSQKHEVGNAYGGVTGGYSYVDANGELQRVEYIADVNGFRVKATNLPVAQEYEAADLPVAPVYTGVAPEPVKKTDEVLAAEAAFFEKFEEAKRAKRSVALPYALHPYATLPYAAPVAHTSYAGLAPVAANTPADTVKAVPAYQTHVSYAAHPNVYANGAYAYGAYAPAFAHAGYAPATYAAPALAAPFAYNTAPVVAAPAVAYAAPVAAAPASIGIESTLETVKLNPGHATAYRVYNK